MKDIKFLDFFQCNLDLIIIHLYSLKIIEVSEETQKFTAVCNLFLIVYFPFLLLKCEHFEKSVNFIDKG